MKARDQERNISRDSLCPTEDEESYTGYSPLLENYAYARPFDTLQRGSKIEEKQQASPVTNSLSPPMSPSVLGIAQTSKHQHTSSIDAMFMPRTSSLNNQHSTPTSPTSGLGPVSIHDIMSSTPTTATAIQAPLLAFPDYAMLSELGEKFVIEVRELNKHRRIFCSIEYPLSFTGQEAVVSYLQYSPMGVNVALTFCG